MGSKRAADSPWLRAVGIGLLVLALAACGANGENEPPPGPTVYKGYALVVAAGSDEILSFSIDTETGGLTAAGGAALPVGSEPRSIALGPGDKVAYVVGTSWDYPCLFRILVDPASGAPTLSNERYCMPDVPHRVVTDPARKFVYVTCGGADRIYGLSSSPGTGSLTVLPGSPFAAPGGAIDIAFEPGGRFAYVLDYDTESVSVYAADSATGALVARPGATVGVGEGPQDIVVDPSGKFLYVTNNLSNDISAFRIDAATGALTEAPGSPFSSPSQEAFPGAIGIEPSGQRVYVVYATGLVVGFRIDDVWGGLTLFSSTGTSWDSPHAIAIEPSGKFAYLAYFEPASHITAHRFDADGALLFVGTLEAGSYAIDIIVARIAQ